MPSEGVPSVVWNLVHCPSLSKQESFWDVEPSIVSCCGRHGVEATEAFVHIAMETVVRSSLEKDETNPITSLSPCFKAILKPGVQESTLRGSPFFQLLLKKTKHTHTHTQNCVTHTLTHMHIPKNAQKL